ncbi:pimeloyl-ACP methyl ester carboxylesterase [Kribbella aluminosa]|uniref:Pimeloyl-ACP methyl ester carboxylesterase n=1 Tax=Kribbella aluminosa TaxID=416017 RepID=A0ABS4UFM7_9ACTN|nr:alpha/beta hydrolase [Kribbella aluminosa]MBP2350444.1 pimeloyl-ACP methyl ester carboxylesterase [Kribbella aluminosa]
MSTPRTLTLPDGVHPVTLETERGSFATLTAVPSIGTPLGTVLLVPGWTGSKEDFTPLVDHLCRYGWRTVAVDQRGQYETAGPADKSAYSLAELGADLVAMSKALGGFSQLVGHSFGGLVAREAVLTDPSVFSTISLLCSGPGAFTDEATLQSLQMLAYGLENLPIEQVYDMKLDHDNKAPGYVAPPADVAAFLRKRFTSNVPTSLAEITRRLTDAEDRTKQLAKTNVRKQVLHGATDDGWPIPAQHAMAAALGVEAEVIPEAGHSPAIDQPAKTARMLVDFFHDYPSLRTV